MSSNKDRINTLLKTLATPKTVQQVEKELGVTRNCYRYEMNNLLILGYLKIVGKIGKAYIWQAENFEYKGEDLFKDGIKVEIKLPKPTLADAHYIHNAKNYMIEHAKTTARTRRERKSPRTHVGISPVYG